MILKIYNDIVNEEERQMSLLFAGIDGTSFDSVSSFIDNIPYEDKSIDLKIDCRGGSISEGWKIYDALRTSGKDISATISGECSSMATVVLLSAPKERRYGMPNAKGCIHEARVPFVPDVCTAEELRTIANQLDEETARLINLYEERTGCNRETLLPLMKEDKLVDMETFLSLGFISKILPPTTAINITKTNNKMKEETTLKKSIVDRLLAKAGLKRIEDLVIDMTLQSADGQTLTIERESGEPQVGDPASPDGEFVMPDGKTIIVKDGVISEIIDPSTETTTIENLQNQIADLQSQLQSAQALKKTEEEIMILNAVAMAGGKDWLASQTTKLNLSGRKFPDKGDEKQNESLLEQRLEAARKKASQII